MRMIDIIERLRNLGYRPLKGDDFNVDALIASLKGEGHSLPEDYETFLKNYPTTGVFDDQVGFEGSEKSPWASGGVEVLECLYGQCIDKRNDLMAVRDQLSSELPVSMLAIGEVTGANFVCIRLDETAFGAICIWDHEHMNDARHGIYSVAPSFYEFIQLLKKIEERPVAECTKFVGMEISESLKARVAQLNKDRNK